jgi:RNA polymerase sigma-70 factor (ECF subfamily)
MGTAKQSIDAALRKGDNRVMTDSELVGKVLSGDTGRFEGLVDRYLPMVRALCASHVYTEAVHDDLVQETFVEGYLKLSTLRRADRFGPWLAQIARRKCQTWLRREGSKQRTLDRLAQEPVNGGW